MKKFNYLMKFLFIIYILFLIKVSFFPLIDINLEVIKINSELVYPESLQKLKDYYLNYEVRFLHIFLFIPLWIFLKYFVKNTKKIFIFWISSIIFIEILQFILTKISIYYSYWVYRIFKIEDIFLNFFWFIIWILIFLLFEKISKKITIKVS